MADDKPSEQPKQVIEVLTEIHGGRSSEYSENLVREGYKPAKPAELSRPEPVQVPKPAQTQNTGTQPVGTQDSDKK